MPFKKNEDKLFRQVSGDQCFWIHDGPFVCSLSDLAKALEDMSETQYQHHVSHEKNDFANWVEHVFEDQELARQLRRAPNQRECQRMILSKLKVKKS